MRGTIRATEVVRNWGQFNDDVVRKGPQFVKRNRDEWVAISKEQMQTAFCSFTFEGKVLIEEDGSTTVSLVGFDLVENGDNWSEAIRLMADAIVDYAEDYMKQFDYYQRDIKRTKHFPYLLNALAQPDIESVIELIDVKY